MRVTLIGFCLTVIVNEKPLNLETATSSVLSVIVNNLWVIPCPYLFTPWSSKNEITPKNRFSFFVFTLQIEVLYKIVCRLWMKDQEARFAF